MKTNYETALSIWNSTFGKNVSTTADFANRKINRDDYDNPNSEFGWTIDFILPASKSGRNEMSNLICVHFITANEKQNKFPIFKANNKEFEIVRTNNRYRIKEITNIYKNGININIANQVWRKYYGNQTKVTDFANRTIHKSLYNEVNNKNGWVIANILPESQNGLKEINNLICVHPLTSLEKGENFPYFKANNINFKIVEENNNYNIVENFEVVVENKNEPKKVTLNQQESYLEYLNQFIKNSSSNKKYYYGEVIIKLFDANNYYLDFVINFFKEYSLSFDFLNNLNGYFIYLRIEDISSIEASNNLVDKLIALKTFLHKFYADKQLSCFEICFAISCFNNKFSFYNNVVKKYHIDNCFVNLNSSVNSYNKFWVNEIVLENLSNSNYDMKKLLTGKSIDYDFKYIRNTRLYEFKVVDNKLIELFNKQN